MKDNIIIIVGALICWGFIGMIIHTGSMAIFFIFIAFIALSFIIGYCKTDIDKNKMAKYIEQNIGYISVDKMNDYFDKLDLNIHLKNGKCIARKSNILSRKEVELFIYHDINNKIANIHNHENMDWEDTCHVYNAVIKLTEGLLC